MAVDSSPTKVELRASVLNAALDLGIRNSVVARWVFDPIAEAEDTDYEESNPGLTTSPSSTNTSRSSHADSVTPSDEYGSEDPHPLTSAIIRSKLNGPRVAVAVPDEHPSRISEDINYSAVAESNPLGAPEIDNAANKVKRHGFRKRFMGSAPADDDTDGGYLSDAVGKKTTKSKGTLFKKRRNKTTGEEYESDGGYLSEAPKSSKKKGKKEKLNAKRALDDSDVLLTSVNASLLPTQEELSLSRSLSPAVRNSDDIRPSIEASVNIGTPSKRKEKEKERGRERDNSNMPETPSKKRGLFRMMTGREKSKERKEKDKDKKEEPEALPPMPKMPLPIAERFARADAPSGRSTPIDQNPLPPLVPSTAIPSTSSGSATPRIASPEPVLPTRIAGSSSINAQPSNSLITRLDVAVPRGSLDDAVGFSSANNSRNGSLDVDRRDVFWKPRSLSPPPVASRKGATSPNPPFPRKKPLFSRRQNSGTSVSSEDESSQDGHGSKSRPTKIGIISGPNPHLTVANAAAAPPSPLSLVAALTSRNGRSPSKDVIVEKDSAEIAPWNKRRAANATDASQTIEPPKSSVRASALSIVVPSSSYIVPSPHASPMPPLAQSSATASLAPPAASFVPSSPVSPGLAAQRQNSAQKSKPMPLGLPTTPTRASVLAYYDIPPPSPPPTTPLPEVPPSAPEVDDAGPSRSRRFLSPNPSRFPSSRSPSPLRPALRSNQTSPGSVGRGRVSPLPSPSPSPRPGGLFNQPIPYAKRGKESPFPSRPILPKEDNPILQNLVSRRPTLTVRSRTQSYRNGTILGEEVYDDGEEGDPIEPLDIEEEAMCLERERARARGEKRVYFSDTTSAEDDGDEAYDGIVQETEVDVQDASAKRPPLEPSHSSSGVDEFFDADEGDDDDRSLYTDGDELSMHSRYSFLDPDRSAAVRERFMKRVESFYNKSFEHGGVDEIPEVPAVPQSLRDAAAASVASALPDRKGILKSSSYF
ncbi:hypothetical protein SCHPADRAFT_998387 [Schizopora paradoxa]|uniref:Uncharacterized protein n=1 Tax=Schizopora paradoxa TaxID=27342 RepID=A0A0H2RKE1_9AGAM|nr:hypothetical protein SCHPADRAFT_998387 [Schizopora paradoxa]